MLIRETSSATVRSSSLQPSGKATVIASTANPYKFSASVLSALTSDIQLPFPYGRRTVTITDQSIPYPIRSQKVAFHTDG